MTPLIACSPLRNGGQIAWAQLLKGAEGKVGDEQTKGGEVWKRGEVEKDGGRGGVRSKNGTRAIDRDQADKHGRERKER